MNYHLSNARWLDKSRALWRRECTRHSFLPTLLPVPGKVEAKGGVVRVTLPTVAGKVVYTAAPVGGWRFEFVHVDLPAALADATVAAAPVAAPAAATVDQLKSDYDALFDLFLDLSRQNAGLFDLFRGLERRLEVAEAVEAKPPYSNVVNIAAE